MPNRVFRILLMSLVLVTFLQGCSQLQDIFNPPPAEQEPPTEGPPPPTDPEPPPPTGAEPSPPLHSPEFTAATCQAALEEGGGDGPAQQQDAGSTAQLSITRFLLDIPVPAPSVAESFVSGPGSWINRYAPIRDFYPFACGPLMAAAWQTSETGSVYVTFLSTDGSGYGTLSLPTSGRRLIGADFDGRSLYYVTTAPPSGGAETALDLRLHRFDLGAERDSAHYSRKVDTGREGLNAIEETSPWHGHASLRFEGGQLGLVMAHLMHRSADGLNHQRAVAAIFNPDTLALQSNLGQTSGHSFEHRLAPLTDRGFLLVDVGDNYPRGVHLHRFGAEPRQSRVVYTFKTLHGKEPRSPAGVEYPVYEEISTGDETFYRWSNDNNTYTELGAAIAVSDGYAVFFIGEPAPDGRALDSKRVGDNLNDARNIGFVLVREDFENASWHESPNFVPDDLILSEATHPSPDFGGFYTFGGHWAPQRNTGVRWLTSYSDPASENATRLRVVEVEPDLMLAIWEVWTRDTYVDTHYMTVDANGSVLSGPHVLSGAGFRVARTDETLVLDGRAWFIDGADGRLAVTSVELTD